MKYYVNILFAVVNGHILWILDIALCPVKRNLLMNIELIDVIGYITEKKTEHNNKVVAFLSVLSF